MAGLLTPLPLQFIRQYAGAIDQDEVFVSTSDRMAYLTNPRRHGGMIVTDLQEQKIYFLNSAKDAWINVGATGIQTIVAGDNITINTTDPSNPIISVEFSNKIVFTITFDGTTGNGEVGPITIPVFNIDEGTYITQVYADVQATLTATDSEAYVTVGIETDDEDSALDQYTGLVTSLNANEITQILTPALTKASAARTIVASVGGSTITAGTLKITLLIQE